MPASWDILHAGRINAIIQALQDVRQIPQELRFLARTPVIPSIESEILGRFVGQVLIADLISDDTEAVVYASGKLQFERHTVPNMKHGRAMSQTMLNQLMAINANGGVPNDQGIFSDYLNREMDALLLGIRQRMEALIIAMYLDGFSYDRLGIKMTNVTWGMPSSLKITVGTAWSNAGSATPIHDLLNTKRIARVQFGETYNRVTMSTAAFMLMIATTEFQSRVKIAFPAAAFPATLNFLPAEDTDYMLNLAGKVLGMTIELYDARYWQQSPEGVITASPFLPLNKVILSFTGNDNNPQAADFANGIVTESMVAQVARTNMIGSLGGPQYGPVGYATAPPDLNPPNLSMWGVARGFPRKHRLQMNAALDVGTVTDDISIYTPF